MSDNFDLLTVDLTDRDAPEKLVRSLRETGFACIINHPIPVEGIEAAYAGWRDFFGSERKHDYLVDPEKQDGYFPFRSENAKGVTAKDLKEFYHVYPTGRVPDDLAPQTSDLYDRLVALGRTILGWIDTYSPPEIRARYSEPLAEMLTGSEMNLLRVLHYPRLDVDAAEPGAVRAAAHEDINLITLLVSGSAPGLQARDAAGRWHEVPCATNMIAINVGDMLNMASGGYFPSTTHRVVNPPLEFNVSRYSMPMFLHPRPEVRLDANYTADDYLKERLREIGLKT